MPNWCENELQVIGEKKEVNKFKKEMKVGDSWLSEEKILPYPEKFRIQDEKAHKHREETGKWDMKDGFNSGGYEWCIDNWGTKWGLRSVEEPEEYGWDSHNSKKKMLQLDYYFDTAWSPPEPLIEKMAGLYPKLEFDLRYFEGGVGFNGYRKYKDGQLSEQGDGDYFGSRGG